MVVWYDIKYSFYIFLIWCSCTFWWVYENVMQLNKKMHSYVWKKMWVGNRLVMNMQQMSIHHHILLMNWVLMDSKGTKCLHNRLYSGELGTHSCKVLWQRWNYANVYLCSQRNYLIFSELTLVLEACISIRRTILQPHFWTDQSIQLGGFYLVSSETQFEIEVLDKLIMYVTFKRSRISIKKCLHYYF